MIYQRACRQDKEYSGEKDELTSMQVFYLEILTRIENEGIKG
jgi:hypothetical protein